MTHDEYTDAEIEQRGEAIYQSKIKPKIRPGDAGKFVTINVETGAWDIGTDVLGLASQLHAAHPDAALYTVRVGSPYANRIGARFGSRDQ